MKKIIFLIIIGIGIVIMNNGFKPTLVKNKNQITTTPTTSPTTKPQNTKHIVRDTTYSIFLPYWTLPDTESTITLPSKIKTTTINNYIYFGIAVDENGINEGERGFQALDHFNRLTDQKLSRKTLTVRMINDEVNEKILENKGLQNTITEQTIALANQHGFDEILYDFEYKALPTTDIKNQITAFFENASNDIKTTNLSFSITLYGDIFYRARPFDIQAIAQFADHIYIMAYDFHKSFGTPGPNFPLNKGDIYDYDLKSMMDDFTTIVKPEKITVIFGMYGYEWEVDAQNRPKKRATALTLNQIHSRYIPCTKKACRVRRDKFSAESEITFVDEQNEPHVIWYEDEKSVSIKFDVLKKMGIGSVSFWAAGYY